MIELQNVRIINDVHLTLFSFGLDVALGCQLALLDLLSIPRLGKRRPVGIGRKGSEQGAVGAGISLVCKSQKGLFSAD